MSKTAVQGVPVNDPYKNNCFVSISASARYGMATCLPCLTTNVANAVVTCAIVVCNCFIQLLQGC